MPLQLNDSSALTGELHSEAGCKAIMETEHYYSSAEKSFGRAVLNSSAVTPSRDDASRASCSEKR